MRSAVLAFATLCVSTTFATKGVDYSSLQSEGTHACWKNAGIDFAIPRSYMSYGAFDNNGPANVRNARAAGIPYVDVYMFPCRAKPAADQVN